MMEYLIGSPGFIKTSTKLPPQNTSVLIFGEYDCTGKDIAEKIPEEGRRGVFYDIARRNDDSWEFLDGGIIEDNDEIMKVTYWSPLPKITE